MLLRLGFARPQVPVHLACFQSPQAGVPLASRAVDVMAWPGGFHRGDGDCPQHTRARRSLLCWDGLSLVLHQKPALHVLLDLHLHPGVSRAGPAGQQLQSAPVVLDGVVPGHLPAVFEAESRVPGSGVRGRGSGERETTASSLAGKQQAREKEDNGGQGKDGPAGAIGQGGNGR